MVFGVIIGLILGWAAGAWVNYLGDVLPWKRRLVAPFCLGCQAEMPRRNYWFYPRRCPACGRRRAWRVYLVELVYIGATIGLWQSPPEALGFAVGYVLLIYFGVVALIDMEHRLILHPVSLTGAALGLGIGLWLHGPVDTLLGGAVGFGSMWVLYVLGEGLMRLLARRRGQPVDEVALGFGDVNLSGVLGLLLGIKLIGLGLFLAILIGGLISLAYLLIMAAARRYHLFMALPYGPFLVVSAVLLLYFPDAIRSLLQ
jgi:leader peptidase (prepilin peptidase)/N-methyltransferase